jgi:hypothetical protein
MASRSTAAQRQIQQQAAAQQRAHVAQLRAERRATYGPYRVADVRTWFGWQWFWGLGALAVVAALPAMLGDGPIAQIVWLIAVAPGLIAWGVWVARLHAAQAPARQAAAARAALAYQQAQAEAARLAAERAAYLTPRQVGNTWRHGACAVNHRTRDAALRCRQG